MPGDIRQTALVELPGKKSPPLQGPMALAERDHRLAKAQQLPILFRQGPVKPVDGVVLAVGIVIAQLCSPDLVASDKHRHTLREHEDGHKVLALSQPQRFYLWVIGRSLYSTVPTHIVIVPITIAFPIQLVMLIVVRNQVIERKAIMGGDEIDAINR